MSDIEEARKLLNRTIRHVINYAPMFYNQIKQIEAAKSELQKLLNEQQSLEDRISKEEEIANDFTNLLRFQEEGKKENFRRYQESIEFFRTEVIKNAKYALSMNRKPLIELYNLRGDGLSPLIYSTYDRLRVIKKKADFAKKIHHLRHLRQNIFCLSEDFDDSSTNIFYNYQINQDLDYLNYKMENFSKPIKNFLIEQAAPDSNYQTESSISNLSQILSSSQFLSTDNDSTSAISLSNFSFKRSPMIDKRDMSIYYDKFNKLISPTFQEIINTIEDLLKEISDIFRIENETIQASSENFFKSNPSFIHTSSILCSNVIFKAQEKIREAQKITYLLNQKILPPETKVYNESQHIQTLLNELVSIFDSIYDRFARSQIISKKISFDFDQQEFQDFTIDELARSQIEKCNSIVSDLKKIFEQSLALNSTFLSNLNDIITLSRENQISASNLNIDIKVPPPPEIDNSAIKEKFLQLKQRILKKQSEQLDQLSKSLEEIPSEIKQIQIKNEFFTDIQPSESPGLHFPKMEENQSETEESNNENALQSLIEFKQNLQQLKSNPYKGSNQILLEKIFRKAKEPTEIITISPKKKEDSDEDSSEEHPNEYYQAIENINNDLSKLIYTDDFDELMKKRESLIEELQQRTEKFNISQFRKNEKMKIKMSKSDLIKSKKEERDELKNQLNESESKLQDISNNIDEIQEEIKLLEKEKDELESQQFRIELLKSKYEKFTNLLSELNEEEQKFNEIQDEK